MRRLSLLLTAVVTVALSGCSGSSTGTALPSDSPTAAVPTTPATVQPTATTPVATTTPPGGTPTGTESPAPLGQPACKAANVTVTDADTVRPRGASYRAEVYVLRTRGPACQLQGYPAVVVQGATVTRGGEGLPPEMPHPYTLSPGTSLSFSLATRVPGGSCTDVSAITVVLPGTTQPKGVVTTLHVCDGRLGVSPVHRLGDGE